jgi:hypothetical protein
MGGFKTNTQPRPSQETQASFPSRDPAALQARQLCLEKSELEFIKRPVDVGWQRME